LNPVSPGKYRAYAMSILLVVFIQAILLIPGIGEDRRYPLDQFYGLRVPLVLLRPCDRNKRIHSHLLQNTRRLHSCNNNERPKHWDRRARRPRIIAPVSSNNQNNSSDAFGPSVGYPVSLCFFPSTSYSSNRISFRGCSPLLKLGAIMVLTGNFDHLSGF